MSRYARTPWGNDTVFEDYAAATMTHLTSLACRTVSLQSRLKHHYNLNYHNLLHRAGRWCVTEHIYNHFVEMCITVRG